MSSMRMGAPLGQLVLAAFVDIQEVPVLAAERFGTVRGNARDAVGQHVPDALDEGFDGGFGKASRQRFSALYRLRKESRPRRRFQFRQYNPDPSAGF